MYGDKALSLLKEIQGNQWIPKYNDETVKEVIEEMNELYKIMQKTIDQENPQDPYIATNLLTHHTAYSRNERCLLAYTLERLHRIRKLRFEVGPQFPKYLEDNLSASERDNFLKKYNELLAEYNRKISLDITSDTSPPKDTFVEVRVLKNYGKISTDSKLGVLNLQQGCTYYLRRPDAELLIRQGIVKQVLE